MSTEAAIKAMETALAGSDRGAMLEAVLALPDDATAAAQSLEAAFDDAGLQTRLEVAILDAIYRVNEDPRVKPRLDEILDALEDDGDLTEEVYMMARLALNRVESETDDPLEAEGAGLRVIGVPLAVGPDRLGVIVHGTWAKNGSWWRDGGDFHTYLLENRGLGYVYSGDKPFVWSGRNRDSARRNASVAFQEWVNQHAPQNLEVYAHSHGANVVMLSTRQGLTVDKLVMLSPPVREDYFADWDQVNEAYNIQAAFDPVVAIAKGGQHFDLPNIVEELILDARSHSASHDPQTWEDNGVPAFIGLPAVANP